MEKFLGAFKQYKLGVASIFLNKLFPYKFSFQNFIVYQYDLENQQSVIPADNEAVKVNKVQNPDNELFKKFRKRFPAEEFASRIKKDNESIYIATKKGEIVAYAWVAEKELFIGKINYLYPLNNDEVFLYSCFVSQKNRGEGIHQNLINERLKDHIKNSRYKTAYTGVLSANKGSIKGVKKAGFKEYKKIKYLKVFDKEKWWFR